MSKYSIDNFVAATADKTEGNEVFELENDYLLDIHLNGEVKAKRGSMVAYTGNISFEKESSLGQGVGKFLKKKLTGEGATMMDCSGNGHLYVADEGKEIAILALENDTIFVNGNDVLAFETSLEWDITMMSNAGYAAGGLFNMKISGTGMVAITTHFKPLTIRVTPDSPVYTDPQATVAWSEGLSVDSKVDASLKTFIGKSSGETFQLAFTGNGFVIIQPFEEIPPTAQEQY